MNCIDILSLAKLCDATAPSGYESELLHCIAREIKPFVDSLRFDTMGNLVATRGEADSLLITAHSDEVGFMVTGFCEDGLLRIDAIGGIDCRPLPSKNILIGENKICGVICTVPVHFKNVKNDTPSFSDLRVDIGAASVEEAKRLVKIGDIAVFDTTFSQLENGSEKAFLAKAFDNRIGCFLLMKLIKETSFNGSFVFTVQEEVGCRGAQAICLKHSYPLAIALDTTTANDLPKIANADRVCHAGKGIVISYADGATVYDHRLVQSAISLLEKQSIPVQTKSKRTGGNEASSMQKCGFGSPTLSLSVPCRYIHGNVGIVLEKDVDSSYLALCKIVERHLEGGFQID